MTVDLHDAEQIQQVAARAAEVFAAGGMVIFPTETVYGVAADAANDAGYAALRGLKARPGEQPFTVHVPTAEYALQLAGEASADLRRFVRKVFPGPVTLIVDVDAAAQRAVLASMGLPESIGERLYHEDTIGLRCPDHPLAEAVLGAVPTPVVASSANPRGGRPPRDAEEAAAALGDAVGLVVDGGPCRYAKPSTIVRVHRAAAGGLDVKVVREGVLDERMIRKLLRWNLLLVCSGNTCRSPMAEAIARELLARRRGLSPQDLEAAGLRVSSAGSFATAGSPASEQAVAVMREQGIDLSRHRSRPLLPEMIHEADAILCMTEGHRRAVLELVPHAADRVMLLDPDEEIADPYGSDAEAYAACARQIREQLERRLRDLEA